jgi:hypothetical protein
MRLRRKFGRRPRGCAEPLASGPAFGQFDSWMGPPERADATQPVQSQLRKSPLDRVPSTISKNDVC